MLEQTPTHLLVLNDDLIITILNVTNKECEPDSQIKFKTVLKQATKNLVKSGTPILKLL